MSKASKSEREQKRERPAVANYGVSKVIELVGESESGWENALQLCVAEATETLRHVETVEVTDMTVSIKDNTIERYMVRCKVRFDIEPSIRHH